MRNPNTSRAYDFLRKKILLGEFRPGQFLSAQSLSKEIGVSRTPVREALRQLECDELVTIVPKLGAVVTTLNEEQFQELLGYREALEVYAAGRAAQMYRQEEITELKAILETMREETNLLVQNPQDAGSLTRLSESDIRFHRSVFVAARNNMVRERFERANILQRMITQVLPSTAVPETRVIKENVMAVFEEHVRIFEAIRDRDRERAQSAMGRHLQNIALKYFRRNSSPLEPLLHGGGEVAI